MMTRWFQRLALFACLVTIFAVFAGCAKREHRKVQVHEEERPGEVQEERPGEMVVE